MTVRLYTRRGCGRCEAVAERLGRLRREFPHTLETLDVDRRQTLRSRYGDVLPVVVIDDRYLLAATFDYWRLREGLERAQRQGGEGGEGGEGSG